MHWLETSPGSFPANISYCSEDLPFHVRCPHNEDEWSKRDAIATLRILVSCLSIIGSLSIIVSVLWRKILANPKIHPIFLISVADCLLGFSWVLGGILWFSSVDHRSWCFLPSLLTVIMQCVTVNLTVVYALIAYSVIKRQDFSALLSSSGPSPRAWQPWKTATAYILAWVVPVVIVLTVFGILASEYHLIHGADKCSCWCLPYFANIVPLAQEENNESATYVLHIRSVVVASSVILLATYLLGFILLVGMYSKILAHIRRVRRAHAQAPSSPTTYGAMGTLLMRGHSQAKKRVVFFLLAFIITGLANVVLYVIFVMFEASAINDGSRIYQTRIGDHRKDHLGPWNRMTMYIAQSLTAPLQGFLNAVVYGWTRDDFVRGRDKHRKVARDGRRASLVSSISGDDDNSTLVDSGVFERRDGSPVASRPRSHSGAEREREGEESTEVKRKWLTVSGSGSNRRGIIQNTGSTTGVM